MRAGVRTVPSDPTTKMFMPPSSSSTVFVAGVEEAHLLAPLRGGLVLGSSEAA